DGTLTIAPAGAINGVSAVLAGRISPSNALIVANTPPGAVIFNGLIAPAPFTEDVDAASPAIVFRPFGFDLTSPYQTTPGSRFDTGLRGLIRTGDAWDPDWLAELSWENPADAAAAEAAREERELAAERRELEEREARAARARSRLANPADEEDEEEEPPPPRRPRPSRARPDRKTARVDRLRDLWQARAEARDEVE